MPSSADRTRASASSISSNRGAGGTLGVTISVLLLLGSPSAVAPHDSVCDVYRQGSKTRRETGWRFQYVAEIVRP